MDNVRDIALNSITMIGTIAAALAALASVVWVGVLGFRKYVVALDKKITSSRIKEKAEDDGFLVVCPICEGENWFMKGGVLDRLQNPTPLAACSRCHANISSRYMESPFVRRAQDEASKLRHNNELTHIVLAELYREKLPSLTVGNTEEPAADTSIRVLVHSDVIKPFKRNKPGKTSD